MNVFRYSIRNRETIHFFGEESWILLPKIKYATKQSVSSCVIVIYSNAMHIILMRLGLCVGVWVYFWVAVWLRCF